MKEIQIPKVMPCRDPERKEKAYPSNEPALQGMVASLNEYPKKRDNTQRKETIINLGLI